MCNVRKRMEYTNTRRNVSGIYIKEARENIHMTKQKLAAKLRVAGLNISSIALGNIESGKRIVGDYELKIFSDVLKVPILQLLGFKQTTLPKDKTCIVLLDREETDKTGGDVYRIDEMFLTQSQRFTYTHNDVD